MSFRKSRARSYWLVYPLWIIGFAILFLALRDAPDPSRRTDRVDKDVAAREGLAILRSLGHEDYEVVHVALAKRGEVGVEPSWLVLCDRRDRTALREAYVVQLRASDGAFLGLKPVDEESAAVESLLEEPAIPEEVK